MVDNYLTNLTHTHARAGLEVNIVFLAKFGRWPDNCGKCITKVSNNYGIYIYIVLQHCVNDRSHSIFFFLLENNLHTPTYYLQDLFMFNCSHCIKLISIAVNILSYFFVILIMIYSLTIHLLKTIESKY